MSHPEFSKAAEYITSERIRDTLSEMVDIPSATGFQLGMARYLDDRMRRAGLDTELQLVDQNRPNAIGHLRGRGNGTNLLFTGHMDTSYSGEEEHLSRPRLDRKQCTRTGGSGGSAPTT